MTEKPERPDDGEVVQRLEDEEWAQHHPEAPDTDEHADDRENTPLDATHPENFGP